MTTRYELAHEAAREGAALAMDGFRTSIEVETKSGPLDSVTELDRAVQKRVAEVLRNGDDSVPVVGEEDLPGIESLTAVPETGFAWVVDPIDGTNNFVAGNRNWGVAIGAVQDGDPILGVNRFPALGDVYTAGSSVAAGDEGETGNKSSSDRQTSRNGRPCSVSDRTDPTTFTVNPVFGVSPLHRTKMADYVDVVVEEFGDMRRFGCAQLALSGVAAGEMEAAVSAVRLNAWDTVAGVHLVRQAGGTVTDVHGEHWTAGSEGMIASNGTAHQTLVNAFDPL